MPLPGEVADPSALRTSEITIESDGVAIDTYLARPAQAGPAPGLIVIHEAFGLVEHIRDLCRRFANIGFNALAPNLYARIGAPDPDDMQQVMPKMFALEDAQVVRDLEEASAYLRALDGATDKVGVIGFCSGGRQSLLMACSSTQVNAAVDCWGGFVARATPDAISTPPRPSPVIDLVPQLHCPLYVVVGETDASASPEDAAEILRRLESVKIPHQMEVFAGAGHAFLADYRPSYDEKAAFTLWPKLTAFFDQHLR